MQMPVPTSRYDAVWRRAEPYMRARKNDVHVPLSFDWAQRLLDAHPEADRDIVSLAILGKAARGRNGENWLQGT